MKIDKFIKYLERARELYPDIIVKLQPRTDEDNERPVCAICYNKDELILYDEDDKVISSNSTQTPEQITMTQQPKDKL